MGVNAGNVCVRGDPTSLTWLKEKAEDLQNPNRYTDLFALKAIKILSGRPSERV